MIPQYLLDLFLALDGQRLIMLQSGEFALILLWEASAMRRGGITGIRSGDLRRSNASSCAPSRLAS